MSDLVGSRFSTKLNPASPEQLLHRSPVRDLSSNLFSMTVVRRNELAAVNLSEELKKIASRTGINLDQAEFRLYSKSGIGVLTPLRILRLHDPVTLLSMLGALRNIRIEIEEKGEAVSIEDLQSLKIASSQRKGEYGQFKIFIRNGQKTAALILTVANKATYDDFIKWYWREKNDNSWQKQLATPCREYSQSIDALVAGDSQCDVSKWRVLKKGKLTSYHHRPPDGYFVVEARENPPKGRWSGAQVIYLCDVRSKAPCPIAQNYPTCGTADRISPGSAGNLLSYIRVAGHLWVDVEPGRTAQNLDGYPDWFVPKPSFASPVPPGIFMSRYLEVRPKPSLAESQIAK